MASKAGGSYSITVNVVDQATSKLAQINKTLKAQQQPFNNFQKQVSQFGKLTGISKVTNGVQSLAKKAVEAGAAIAGISAVGSVAGVYALATAFAANSLALSNMSQSLGISATNLSNLQGAAGAAGISADTLNGSLQSLADTAQDAVGGRNVQAATAFRLLGVDIRKTAFEAKSANEILLDSADALAKLNDKPAIQRHLARQAGISDALAPFYRKGKAGILEMQALTAKFNPFPQSQVDAGLRLQKAFWQVTQASEGFKNTIITALEPVLTPLMLRVSEITLRMSQWVQANQGLIQTKVKEWIEPIANWLKQLTFKDVAHYANIAKDVFIGLTLIKVASFLAGINPLVLAFAAAVTAIAIAWERTLDAYNNYQDRLAFEKKSKEDFAPAEGPQARYDARAKAHTLPPDMQREYDESHGLPSHRGHIAGGTAKGPIDLSAFNGSQAKAMAAYATMGYGKDDSAGMVANFVAESGLKPNAVGDGGKAYGIGQWHKDRQDLYTKLFGHTMQSVRDMNVALNEQLRFSDWELHHNEKNALKHLQEAKGGYGKGYAISKYYERPAAVEEAANNRGNLAAQIAGNSSVSGNIKVDINHNNVPQGANVVASSSGKAFSGQPSIKTTPMPSYASP